ncbi:uncharacterized protein L969DRAFT_46528 [Mixia osmundae IAM 14324]|uniref:ZZ-type domain-containing protein n=1 Tax=Mixia osmundae (strain CBS 9802 / IAM 14324 / JCM 22182 / KY 12970) TaxID=764103 RepID=G7E6C6_MIXOS|nr:uncharacterized protein L969DRAFT_46528 [Mixia osmundae IAM 14324]KEI40457.1 hypothetical protein L969DRAFT_46528 [Mixia osmundae IAM 14324]GAA98386.1 hypothetical protein E5Q_05072 [Mixia osmundae IAM 14324]
MTPLTVKAVLTATGHTRRLTFPDTDSFTYDLLSERLAQSFGLPGHVHSPTRDPYDGPDEPSSRQGSYSTNSCAGSLRISFQDDDGDQLAVENDDDLLEAINFFAGDDVDAAPSIVTQSDSIYARAMTYKDPKQKLLLRLSIAWIQEADDAPSLSESEDGESLSQSPISVSTPATRGSVKLWELKPPAPLHVTNGLSPVSARLNEAVPPMPATPNTIDKLPFDPRRDGSWSGREAFHRSWHANNVSQQPPSVVSAPDSQLDDATSLAGTSVSRSISVATAQSSTDPTRHLQRNERRSSLRRVPGHLLKCAECKTQMHEIRYVCQICGPLRPHAAQDPDLWSPSTARDIDEDIKETPELSEPDDNDDARSVHTLSGNEQASTSSETRDDEEETCGYELCPHCVEYAGPEHSRRDHRTVAFPAAFCEVACSPDGYWSETEELSEALACTLCGASNLVRWRCLSCAKLALCYDCFAKAPNFHPQHCFEVLPAYLFSPPATRAPSLVQKRLANYRARSTTGQSGFSNSSNLTTIHSDAICHRCLDQIVGPRYHCAVCRDVDLCSQCEIHEAQSDHSDIGPHHHADHVMLKINVPITDDQLLSLITSRVRDLWHPIRPPRRGSGDSGSDDGSDHPHRGGVGWRKRGGWRGHHHSHHHGHHHGPPPPWARNDWRDHPGPPGPPYGPPDHRPSFPPPQPVYLVNPTSPTAPMNLAQLPLSAFSQKHGAICQACQEHIVGVRYRCAMCESTRQARSFDLCSRCEPITHHPRTHVFLMIRTPRHAFAQLLLPDSLYDSNTIDESRATLHTKVRCDGCQSSPIVGEWYRCLNCREGYDLCRTCITNNAHPAEHCFLKLSRRVDMDAFKVMLASI